MAWETERKPFQFGLRSLLIVVTVACLTVTQPLHTYSYTKFFVGDFTVCGPDKIIVLDDGWVLIGQRRLNPYLFAPTASLRVLLAARTACRLRRAPPTTPF